MIDISLPLERNDADQSPVLVLHIRKWVQASIYSLLCSLWFGGLVGSRV